jgi:hypothetical protein
MDWTYVVEVQIIGRIGNLASDFDRDVDFVRVDHGPFCKQSSGDGTDVHWNGRNNAANGAICNPNRSNARMVGDVHLHPTVERSKVHAENGYCFPDHGPNGGGILVHLTKGIKACNRHCIRKGEEGNQDDTNRFHATYQNQS